MQTEQATTAAIEQAARGIPGPPEAPKYNKGVSMSHNVPAPVQPIRVDLSNLELLDIPLLGEFDHAESLPPADQFNLMQRAIPMFDRLVVGGLKGYKFDQLRPVVEAIGNALRERSDSKN